MDTGAISRSLWLATCGLWIVWLWAAYGSASRLDRAQTSNDAAREIVRSSEQQIDAGQGEALPLRCLSHTHSEEVL